VPFANSTELIMDLLRFGPDVRVMSPASLAREIAERHRLALKAAPSSERM
jgi:predicted DNA-binding transcriptional regulator YafY